MSELANLRNELKLTVRALLKSFPTPMTPDMLEKDYVIQVGRKIPFLKLGYPSLIDYLESIPEAVKVEVCDDSIILKASSVEYVTQLPSSTTLPHTTETNRHNNIIVFVPHHIQHHFYTFVVDRKTGVPIAEVEQLWGGGKVLEESGIQCTVREFLQTSITHLAYLRNDHVYPINLKNLRVGNCEMLEEMPVLRLAAHIDDRTKQFMRKVLVKHVDGVNYLKFPEVYKQETGVHFECSFWGYHSVLEMALHMPELFHCIQTGPSNWKLLAAHKSASRTGTEQSTNSSKNEPVIGSCVMQNGFADRSRDAIHKCGCERKAAVVRRLYRKADFLKTLKSSTLSCDSPCGKFHVLAQLQIPPNISPGTTIQIHVSEVESPDRFYFVLKAPDGKEVLDHLLTVMYEFYSTSHRRFQVHRDDVAEGLFCVVLYSGRCLRAQVRGVVDDTVVLVRFVDYGVVVSSDVDNLYYFHPAFGFLPQQALAGRVAHVRPVVAQRGWPRDASLYLYNILVNSLVSAIVTAVDTEQQVVTARLVAEVDDGDYVHVDQKMVALGYAVT